jgi:geranylgeranyl pyrophosphate synthase
MSSIAATEKKQIVKNTRSDKSLYFESLELVSKQIIKCRFNLEEPLRSAFDHHFKKSGKLLRANLALRASQASGLSECSCIRWATSVELLHNASLVHDDVCDDDAERRGITSVSEMYGKEIAICLGDAMIALSSLLLAEDQSLRYTLPAHNLAILRLSAGQAAEFATPSYPTWTTYEKLVEGKTTPLISLPVLGLNPVGCDDAESQLVSNYFSITSVAFQMMNDIQNINLGKQTISPASDLRELRPNAVIAKFYEELPELDKKLFAESRYGRKFVENNARLNFWWEKILLSNSMESTRQTLNEKLRRSERILDSLSIKNKSILQPFDRWLHESYSKLSSL